MENTNVQNQETTVITEEVAVNEPAKRTAPKREKSRPVEELKEASVRGMSTAELKKLVEALKEELSIAEGKVSDYKTNCDRAYEALRKTRDEANSVMMELNAKVKFMEQAVGTCYSSILMANK